MMFENLEDRRLLSAAANLASGTLTITGTTRNDTIYVSKQGVSLNVRVNNARQTFKLADVKKMVVNALAGNDNVSFGYGTIGATINAGDGNDRVIGTSSNDTINGGSGNDYLHAWVGNDVVNGDAGNDVIIGCLGNDTIHGNAGNDLISGAQGDDQIFGDAGNDTLFGAAGYDKVDGGDGNDAAGKEGNDTFTRVEKIWR
jgi:Ca2+-binding RTX toxin-like protein